jgi:hypothetical protein
VFETLAVIGTITGLLALIASGLAWSQAQKADPKGLRTDFRRLDQEWDNTYEQLMRLEKRLAKRADREEKSRAGANGEPPGVPTGGFASDAEVAVAARQRGMIW